MLREARTSTRFLIASVLVGALTAGLVIAQAWLLSGAIAFLHADPATLLSLTVVLAGRAGLLWAQEVLAYRSSAAVKSTLRRRVLAAAVRSAVGDRPGQGATAGGAAEGPTAERTDHSASDGTRLTLDRDGVTTLLGPGLDALDGYFARYLPQLVLALVVPVAILVTLFGTDLVSAGTVALTLPLIPVFMVLVGLATRAFAARRFDALAILAHHFTDVVSGLPTLKIFGRAKAQARSVGEVSDAYRVESVRSMRLAFLSALVLELLASLSVALVAVGIGIRLVDGTLDLRTGLMVLILAPEAYLPLRMVGQHFHASADGLAAAEQALAYPKVHPAEPNLGDDRLPIDRLDADRDADRTATSLRTGQRASGPGTSVDAPVRERGDTPGIEVVDLAIRGVSGLSFSVRPGELVTLYGPSGSGKSSVLAVLLGLLTPRAGTARVSGGISWVPQRPYLFAGTLAENVRLGVPDASDELVEQAFADAALTSEHSRNLVADLRPDRVIGEGGAGLSSGQRRRVAVARALLVPAERAGVVLLDEPTAGLDVTAERRIARTAKALATSGRAVLLVTHRAGMAAVADRVVAL